MLFTDEQLNAARAVFVAAHAKDGESCDDVLARLGLSPTQLDHMLTWKHVDRDTPAGINIARVGEVFVMRESMCVLC